MTKPILIPISCFYAVPSGCPVLWGERRWKALAVQVGGSVAVTRKSRSGKPSTRVAPAHQVQVVLATEAHVRAFVAGLIVSVKFPPGKWNDTKYAPGVVWDAARDQFVLLGYILDSGMPCAYMPRLNQVYGATAEEALLKGLGEALRAADFETAASDLPQC